MAIGWAATETQRGAIITGSRSTRARMLPSTGITRLHRYL
jgi:hypothetical protein